MVCFYMAFLPSEGIPPWCHPERSDDDPSKSMIWVTDHMHEMQESVLQQIHKTNRVLYMQHTEPCSL